MPTPYARCVQWNSSGTVVATLRWSVGAAVVSATGSDQLRGPRVSGQRAGSMQLIGQIHSAKLT